MLSPSGGKCWVPGLGVKREKVSESVAVSFQIFCCVVMVRHDGSSGDGGSDTGEEAGEKSWPSQT